MLFFLKNVNYKHLLFFSKITVREGVATFITGKSGAGKSTLFKLLNGSISPSSGIILYKDKPLSTWDTAALRREIILVNQNVFLFDTTIEKNFLEFFAYRRSSPPEKSTMCDFLNLCGVDFDLSTSCQTMSAGERQRVFIAICLSFIPKVLLLDEPTSALDYSTANLVFKNIKSHCQKSGTSLLAICHDQSLSERYADDLLVIEKEELKLR